MNNFLISILIQYARCEHTRHPTWQYNFNGSSTNCNDNEIEKYILPGQNIQKGEERVKMTLGWIYLWTIGYGPWAIEPLAQIELNFIRSFSI